jgi:glycerophosphoryl diester phosphodiesterase
MLCRGSALQLLGSAPSSHGREFFTSVLEAGGHGFSLDYNTLSADFVYQSHKRMLPVLAWTVNGQDTIRSVLALGVDGVLSDEPDLVIALSKQV